MLNDTASAAAAALVQARINDDEDFDIFADDTLTDLRDELQPRDFQALCEENAVCHVHVCDIEICNDDDNPECRSFR